MQGLRSSEGWRSAKKALSKKTLSEKTFSKNSAHLK
jgi:hypothetical protein